MLIHVEIPCFIGRLNKMYYTATAKSLQSCPTLCDPIGSSPPGSPVPGMFQARVLEWGAIAFSECTIRYRIYIYMCVCVCMCVWYIYVCACTYTYICGMVFVCVCVCVYIYIYIHHTHITHTMKYYSAIRKDELLPFARTWMDLEGTMLSEISQTEEDKYCITSLICETLKIQQTNE